MRLCFILFFVFAVIAMILVQQLSGNDSSVILTATTDGSTATITQYVSTCQLNSGYELVTRTQAPVLVLDLKGTQCTDLSFVLHLVSVACVFVFAAILLYVGTFAIAHRQQDRERAFAKGALMSMGAYGALMLFLAGWAIFAVGWFADANMHMYLCMWTYTSIPMHVHLRTCT